VAWIHLAQDRDQQADPCEHDNDARTDIFKALKIKVVIVCIMAPCSCVGGYQRF
jgi:hypothetical protein